VVTVDVVGAASRGLVLPPEERAALWRGLAETVEGARAPVDAGPGTARFEAEASREQAVVGERLRRKLSDDGWLVVSEAALPIVCFVDATHPAGRSADYLEAIARDVVVGGRAWVSKSMLGGTTPVLRACVGDARPSEDDLNVLVETLDISRHRIGLVWPASVAAASRAAIRCAEASDAVATRDL
jgi:hypothetical protein